MTDEELIKDEVCRFVQARQVRLHNALFKHVGEIGCIISDFWCEPHFTCMLVHFDSSDFNFHQHLGILRTAVLGTLECHAVFVSHSIHEKWIVLTVAHTPEFSPDACTAGHHIGQRMGTDGRPRFCMLVDGYNCTPAFQTWRRLISSVDKYEDVISDPRPLDPVVTYPAGPVGGHERADHGPGLCAD